MRRVSASLAFYPFSINERRSTLAEPFLNELMKIIEQVKFSTDQLCSLQCKHFFNGAAAYYNGAIFMTVSPVGLALKLDEDDCQAIMELGGKHLRYFPKAPIKRVMWFCLNMYDQILTQSKT